MGIQLSRGKRNSAKKQNPKQTPSAPAQSIPLQPSHSKNVPSQHPVIEAPLYPTLPSLSPPRLFSRPHSETRDHSSSSAPKPQTRQRIKSVSNENRQRFSALIFCTETLDSLNIDHQLKKTLNPLTSLKIIDSSKKVSTPYLFRCAPMVTTFVRPICNSTKELWISQI